MTRTNREMVQIFFLRSPSALRTVMWSLQQLSFASFPFLFCRGVEELRSSAIIMSTPTNFYKNSAFQYARDFDVSSVLDNLHAYRLATGGGAGPPDNDDGAPHSTAAAAADDPPSHSAHQWKREKRKHHPYPRFSKRDQLSSVMHSSDVAKLKLESLGYKPLADAEPRGNASSVTGFDAYVRSSNDERGSQAAQERNTLASLLGFNSSEGDSSDDDGNVAAVVVGSLTKDASYKLTEAEGSGCGQVVAKRVDQRFAVPGEPECVVCGRFGAYICDETEDDVCSLECKEELLELQATRVKVTARETDISFSAPSTPLGALQLPEEVTDEWDYKKNRFNYRQTSLSTFRCWKCKRPGHLPEDCLVPSKQSAGPILQALYQRCKEIESDAKRSKCDSCGTGFNLACCLDCNKTFCDSQGHLTFHLRENPSHRRIYSRKLHRLVKCCKGPCPVVDMRELLACHSCLSKAFDKHYSMYNATWQGAGLKLIINAICCDAHFNWHRMNCESADVEDSASLLRKDGADLQGSQFNEFLF